MLDDFFVRALLAGVGVAVVAGPLGCFVIWRRMAYFGDTMAHAALLGVALGVLVGTAPVAGVFVVALAVALALLAVTRAAPLPRDAVLGILSHSTLAAGLVVLSMMEEVRVDLMAYLFGDILAVSRTDLAVVAGGDLLVLAGLALIWRPLIAATVDADIARVEGVAPRRAELAFLVLVAAVIALAMQIVGVLLITALLIIPAATARGLAASPERMAVAAASLGAAAAVGGLALSLAADTPAGPSVVVAAAALFLVQMLVRLARPGAR